MNAKELPTIKVCILGETGVGKTCISSKLTKGEDYVHNYLEEPTIGASFMCKRYDYKDKYYRINIWDTAGQERYRSLASMYYRGVVVALLVYDVTNYDSWNELDYWIGELRKNTPNSTIIVIGNKFDLKEDIKVDGSDIDEFINKYDDIKHIFYSAKVGYKSNKILDLIVDDFEDKIEKGVLLEIPLHSPKNASISLDKERYWCYNILNWNCC